MAVGTFKYPSNQSFVISSKTCTCSMKDKQTVIIGTAQTITLEYQKYYSWATPPRLKYTYEDAYGKEVELGYEYLIQQDSKTWSITTDFVIDGEPNNRMIYITIYPAITYVGLTIVNNLTNCTTTAPNGKYDADDLKSITLTCSKAYEFQAIPTLSYTIGIKETTIEFEKVSDTEYSINMAFPSTTITVTGEAIKKTVITDKYGTIGVYRLSKDELREVSKKRWVKVSFDPQTYQGATIYHIMNEEYIDTAKYVVGLFKLPLTLNVGDKEALWFGPYDMEMQCDTITDDVITLDFGSVKITGKYGNSIDYENTEIEIYIPFIGFTSLKPSDFMDKAVHLKYQINALNGDTLVIIEADSNPIITLSCNVATVVPFQLGRNEYQDTNLNPNMTYIANTPPFINVKTKNAIVPLTSYPYNTTKFYAKFGDLSGYTEATEIDMEILSPHITVTEIEEIKSLLEGGVFL